MRGICNSSSRRFAECADATNDLQQDPKAQYHNGWHAGYKPEEDHSYAPCRKQAYISTQYTRDCTGSSQAWNKHVVVEKICAENMRKGTDEAGKGVKCHVSHMAQAIFQVIAKDPQV